MIKTDACRNMRATFCKKPNKNITCPNSFEESVNDEIEALKARGCALQQSVRAHSSKDDVTRCGVPGGVFKFRSVVQTEGAGAMGSVGMNDTLSLLAVTMPSSLWKSDTTVGLALWLCAITLLVGRFGDGVRQMLQVLL